MLSRVIQMRRLFPLFQSAESLNKFVWILAMLGATQLLASSPLFAQVPSVNGQIAYVACGPSSIPFFPNQCDIWVMNSDGSGQTNLTNTMDLNEVGPAWSPDGTRIAFLEGWSTYTLMVMNADGSGLTVHPTTLSQPSPAAPTWSPGGTQVAFQGFIADSPLGSRTDIVAMDLSTGVETIVTQPVGFGGTVLDAQEIEPAWSPDGGKIAFASVRPEQYPDPVTGEPTEGAQWEIVIVNPDGSGDQVVSSGPSGSDRARFLEEDRAPAWSPDGSMLVFMSQAQIPACCGPWQIWAVNRDGTGATNLSNDDTVNDMFPAWSPDGTQIVFSRSNGSGGMDLYAMPAPTSLPPQAPLRAVALAATAREATRLTFGSNASDPDWGREPGTLGLNAYGLFARIGKQGFLAGGWILSWPAGIFCGRDCSQAYSSSTTVRLWALPRKGSVFAGWAGACSGTAPSCSVTMDDVRTVEARFKRAR